MDQADDSKKTGIRWWYGLVLFCTVMLFQLLFASALVVCQQFGLLGDTPEEITATFYSPQLLILQVLLISSVLTAISLSLPRLFRVSGRALLRLGRPPPLAFVAAGIGIVGVGFLVDEVLFVTHQAFPDLFSAAGLEAFGRVFRSVPALWFVIITAVVTVGPGVGEEFFFRGVVLRVFHRDMSAPLAVLASAVLFGVMHLNPLQSLGAGLIGVYLGFVALRTGSIWPSVFAHALNNAICAFFARYGEKSTAEVWNTGHPLWLLALSLVVLCVAVVALERLVKSGKDRIDYSS